MSQVSVASRGLSAGESCYINVANGNSSYTLATAAAAAALGRHGDGCRGNAVCGMTLTDPVNYYNDSVLLRMRAQDTQQQQHAPVDSEEGMYVCLMSVCRCLCQYPAFAMYRFFLPPRQSCFYRF